MNDVSNAISKKQKKDLGLRDPFLHKASHLKYFVGTAGWSTIPKELKKLSVGSTLEKYAEYFNCVEINSSFYRIHKPSTYEKWAASVPDYFRFSVKLLRYFTQEKRLHESGSHLQEVLEGISNLGKKWGALLVQLPPSLDFEFTVASEFIDNLRKYYSGNIVWEPRHISWTSDKALDLFNEYRIHKVMADPELCPINQDKLNNEDIQYFRLHGTPQIYKSKYPKQKILRISKQIKHTSAKDSWCIFDNTTFGYATENAFELQKELYNQ